MDAVDFWKLQQIDVLLHLTVCSPNEYAKEVMEIRPSGYLTKVVEIEDIRKAMSELLYSV